MKKKAILPAAVLCLFLLGGCGGKANWDGAFYMKVDEYNTKGFDIAKGEEFISFTQMSINTFGGGIAKGSVTGGAELKKGNTAENGSFRFSLSGDTLTVKALTPDEYDVAYEGKYTRGKPLPAADETNGAGNEISNAGKDDSGGNEESEYYDILTSDFYYLNGDEDADSLYFYYGDNIVDFDIPGEETEEGTYSIDGDTITIKWNLGMEIILTIEDGGATLISEMGEYYYLAD